MSAIILHREILQGKEYQNAARLKVFVTLLCLASEQERIVDGVKVERGGLVTSLSKLATQTRLTIKQVRSALTALCKAGKITRVSTPLNSTITISNYDSYIM